MQKLSSERDGPGTADAGTRRSFSTTVETGHVGEGGLMAAGGRKMVNTSCGMLKLMIGALADAAGAGVAQVHSVMHC